MGDHLDKVNARPQNIDDILNSLERYNPETTTVFQDYVTQQCEDRTYDCFANLALLKLYQFNPHLLRDDTVTSILVKSLTVFPQPDFSLCLHLLPPHILGTVSPSNPLLSSSSHSGASWGPHGTQPHHQADTNGSSGPAPVETPLVEAIHKLTRLNLLLEQAEYERFWDVLEGDDLYADLTADVAGFEELMRVRIAVMVGQIAREVERGVVEGWLNLRGSQFEGFVMGVLEWGVGPATAGSGGGGGQQEGGEVVRIPVNKENEAKGTVVREEVRFEMFDRVVRRGFEVPV